MKKLALILFVWTVSMTAACFGQTYLASTIATDVVVVDSRGIDSIQTVPYLGSKLRIETTVTLKGGGIVPSRQHAILSALNEAGRYSWSMIDQMPGEMIIRLPELRKDLLIPTSDGGFSEVVHVKIFVPKGTEIVVVPQV